MDQEKKALLILHQSRSSYGDVGIKLKRRGFTLDIKEINSDDSLMINDIKVEYFKVDHKPVVYAFGYNFIYDNKKITFSGDTKPCKNLD